MPEYEGEFLSQGVDYLGFLNSELRGLQGFTTLANELIQNADDARASWVSFDVRDDVLVVENSALFSDCAQVERHECPWLDDPAKGYRCDLHRFRRIAGGDKRRQGGTIGAFGIGFISVYQVTDQPEMLSGCRHWIIRPGEAEGRRIEQRIIEGLSHTRFLLPWATDPRSEIRQTLQVQRISRDITLELLNELQRSLPRTITFLRHISEIRLNRNGESLKRIRRTLAEDRLAIQDGDEATVWRLVHSSFEDEARRLKGEYAIEPDRSATVTLALPEQGGSVDGLVFAFLPTQQRTGLPLHINADFYPSPDRKRILLQRDFQGEWNRAAVRAGAQALADALPRLTGWMGHDALWRLLQKVEQTHAGADADLPEAVFGEFWERAKDEVREAKLIFTSQREWIYPREALLLSNYDEEREALPILEHLGLKIVHEELRPYYSLLTKREIGVSVLGAPDLARALMSSNLDRPPAAETEQAWLLSDGNHDLLGREMGRLLARLSGDKLRAAQRELASCAVALSCERRLTPPQRLFKADPETIEIFKRLGLSAHFLGPTNPEAVAALTTAFSTDHAITLLEGMPPESFRELWAEDPRNITDLVRWLEKRGDIVTEEMSGRVRALPVWPSGGDLCPLDDLVVPGDFTDPLQIASVVNLDALGVGSKFLLEIGAKELTIITYASEQVGRVFESEGEISAADRRRLVQLFAEKFSELGDDEKVRTALADCPIVDCLDGEFRAAGDVYFDDSTTLDLLGGDAPVARVPVERRQAVCYLLAWLGVARQPRVGDLIEKVRALTRQNPQGAVREAIQKIFAHLARRWADETDRELDLSPFKTLTWLPAMSDYVNWHQPGALYASFRRYLFHSQAKFLDIDQQEKSSEFLGFLGVKSEPTVEMVVNHLLKMASAGQEVNKEVYTTLNRHADHPAVLWLRGQKCLLLGGGRYVRPDEVFWEEPGFGPYRFRLDPDMRGYGALFEQLGVREHPTEADAVNVLTEISSEFSPNTTPLDPETKAVVLRCWKLLSEVSEQELRPLRGLKVIPDNRSILEPAQNIFFDDRPGLAERFRGYLQHNVINRPHDAWRGMQAAGVRPLSGAVQTRLVEREDPAEDQELRDRIIERKGIIARVIEAHRQDDGQEWDLSLLLGLRVVSVSSLAVSHSLRVSTYSRTTTPVPISAYFDPSDTILYYERDDETRWAAIARELAYALNPQAEAGKVAPGLKEVLSARSVGEAAQSLDEFGYASLDVTALDVSEAGTVALGGSEEESETAVPGQATSTSRLSSTQEPVGGGEGEGDQSHTVPGKAIPTHTPSPQPPVGAPDDSWPGRATAGTTPGPERGTQHGGTTTGTGGAAPPSRPPGRRAKHNRLLSYVAPKDAYNEDEPDTEAAARRGQIDEAGIKRVKVFEATAGRETEVMPHHNEGFDIKSYDSAGLNRYIEVKSLSGDWSFDNVKLTHTQFKHSQKLGDQYWVYVVERAEREDFEIHRIQNPFQQVTSYVFDHEWQGMGEGKGQPDDVSLSSIGEDLGAEDPEGEP